MLASICRLVAVTLLSFAAGSPVAARFVWVPAERVDEVPIERLLANVKRNAQRLPQDYVLAQIGRLHLLAYIRDSDNIPVYHDRPDSVADGEIGDCVEMDKRTRGRPNDAALPVRKRGERCEARAYDLDWYRAIPVTAHDQPRRLSSHLAAAIDALSRARIDPKHYRTRLSLAFDRAARLEEARADL